MTSYDEVIQATIENIKWKNIFLYQAIQKRKFYGTFFNDFLSLSQKLEERGLHDFKIRTTNGLVTAQPLAIGLTLTYLKIQNEDFNTDEFLLDLGTPKNGYLRFGYLLSSKIDHSLSISDEIEIYPVREVEKQISAINHKELFDFLDHTSPEFHIDRDKLAVLLIKIPLKTMVCEDGSSFDDEDALPGVLANEKLKELQELFSLISDRAIKILVSWGSYSDHRLDHVTGMSLNKNREYYAEGFFASFVSCMAETTWDNSKELYDLILREKNSKELKIALNRVFLSMSNTDFKGKIIDLSIAMEVMCVSGKGDNTYKVSNHMAWLCSDESETRLQIMKTVKDFYELRSSIVHEGILREKVTKRYGGGTQLYEIVLAHVKEALIRLLKYGSKPNWEKVAARGGVLEGPTENTLQENAAG